MRIQRARQTGQRCGNGKRDELIPRDIDAHGFRCDAVVPDGHDRTARAGIDEVQNDEERDENKYKAQPESGASRHAGDALCAVDDHIACLVQVQRKRVLQRNMEAGRISAERTAKDAFKATERRLYGLPTLKIKLEDDLERLEEFKLYGPRERSKSITRFVKNGNRLTPDEIWEAVLMDMEATIAADRYEIETLERALATVRDDPYYRALSGKYLDDVDDRDIAEALECDTSTVWRHRKRLVQRVAVWLYGAEALR